MTSDEKWDIRQVTRPKPRLMTYYFLQALASLPAFPFVLLFLYFRFRSLRYRFDGQGVSMSWGILYRREIHLTYARIQDIHLVSNVVERWMGLARLHIQTASAQSGAEMTLEGLDNVNAVRDYLYGRLRGVKESSPATAQGTSAPPQDGAGDLAAEFDALATELRALRATLAAQRSEGRSQKAEG